MQKKKTIVDKYKEMSYSQKLEMLEKIYRNKKTDRGSIQCIVDSILTSTYQGEYVYLDDLFKLVQFKRDLKSIANNAPSVIWRRRAAIRLVAKNKENLKPEDELLVKDIAIKERSSCVDSERNTLIKRVKNQDILFEIIKKSRNVRVKKTAIRTLNNQEYLNNIVLDKKMSKDLRFSAIEQITNRNLLKAIADDETLEDDMRWVAISLIMDQDFLKEIVTDDSYPIFLRESAIYCIKDVDFRIYLYQNNNTPEVIKNAIWVSFLNEDNKTALNTLEPDLYDYYYSEDKSDSFNPELDDWLNENEDDE